MLAADELDVKLTVEEGFDVTSPNVLPRPLELALRQTVLGERFTLRDNTDMIFESVCQQAQADKSL